MTKMPKLVSKHLTDPNSIIQEFGGSKVWEYNCQKKAFFCKLCAISCDAGRKSLLRQHVESMKHKKNLHQQNPKQQTLKLVTVDVEDPNNKFAEDLCKAFISSNIPLTKSEHPAIMELFEKYAKVSMPSRRTLTRIMERETQELLSKIKTKLVEKALFVAVDETTDCTGRAMCAILVGPLDGSFLERPFLVDLANINRANNKTVQQFVTTALFKLLGDDLDYQEVRLFLTDGAAYCLKAGAGLKTLFPNMIHVTCLAHGLNRVAEKVRYTYPKVDKLIAKMKKSFVKNPRRRADFAAACQVPLPPEPVLTR